MENSESKDRKDRQPEAPADDIQATEQTETEILPAADTSAADKTDAVLVEETVSVAGGEMSGAAEEKAGEKTAEDKQEPQARKMPEIPSDAADRESDGNAGDQSSADENQRTAGAGQSGQPGSQSQVPPRFKETAAGKGPAGQIEKASGNPAAAVILAAVALVCIILGGFGGWWLIAGMTGMLLAVASVFFGWHAWDNTRFGTLALTAGVTVAVLGVYSLALSAFGTVQAAAVRSSMQYEFDDHDDFFSDPRDEAREFYREYFDGSGDVFGQDDDWFEDDYGEYWN